MPTLYHLVAPGTIYIRNFSDRGDQPLYPHQRLLSASTSAPIRKIEVTLVPHQQPITTNGIMKQLIQFNRDTFLLNRSWVCSKDSPFHYIAQIDWSFLSSPQQPHRYLDINKLVDSLPCRRGLVSTLAFTNIVPGGQGFRSSELCITSTGTTRLKLPIHAFLDDGLVTYLCAGLPTPLTEIWVDDTLPVDETTLSWACRNLSRLLEKRAYEIRHATFPITLQHIHAVVHKLPLLYDLMFTQPKTFSSASLPSFHEETILSSFHRQSNISIVTLPAIAFTSRIRNALARLRRLQELRIVFSSTTPSPSSTIDFDLAHLPAHHSSDFKHLQCLTLSGGSLPQFRSLLPTIFPSPTLSPPPTPTPRPSTSSLFSSLGSRSSTSSFTPLHKKRFINLTLTEIPYLVSKHDVHLTLSAINQFVPSVDIVKFHVKDWGPGEPKGGSWWTRTRVVRGGLVSGCDVYGSGMLRLPGRVMSDFVHPSRKDIGSKAKWKSGGGKWKSGLKAKKKNIKNGEGKEGLGKWIGGLLDRLGWK